MSPVIDIINKNTMDYTIANTNIKGGFGKNLHFKWDSLSDQVALRRRDHPTEAIRTPAIAGGLFAVSKKYFEHISTYDSGMEIWGGENIGKWRWWHMIVTAVAVYTAVAVCTALLCSLYSTMNSVLSAVY